MQQKRWTEGRNSLLRAQAGIAASIAAQLVQVEMVSVESVERKNGPHKHICIGSQPLTCMSPGSCLHSAGSAEYCLQDARHMSSCLQVEKGEKQEVWQILIIKVPAS